MFRNYILVAWRNLLRSRLYTFINILGLALGLSCFMLIMLFVQDELSYDRYHNKADRIYRLCEKIDLEGQGENSSSNPFPTGPAIRNDFPQLVEQQVRFFDFQVERTAFKIEDKKFNEENIFFADSTVFKVFDFPLEVGKPDEVLSGPNKIIISRELARKFFGEEDPLGKTVLYDGVLPLKVSGILGEIPPQSHFQFEALISFPTLQRMIGKTLTHNWVWNPNWTYLLLEEGVSPEELEAQFPNFIQKYYPDFMKEQITHYLQPLTDIHLTSHLDYEIEPNSDESNIFTFTLIGIFILLIASINFMNLATARSIRRAHEVGVRKVLGAHRLQLIGQFLSESVMISLFALLFSFLLISWTLPAFNQLAGKAMTMEAVLQPIYMLSMLGIAFLVGLLSGVYPALYLSSFQPVEVMKGHLRAGRGNRLFRKGLVSLQFAISLGLIISTVVIYKQYRYLQASDPGFAKDQILVIPTQQPMKSKYELFKEGLKRDPHIMEVSKMNEVIGVHHNVHEYNFEGMKEGEWMYFPGLIVDEDFVETLGLEVVAGRDFAKETPTDDTLAVLVNETMVRERGWESPEEALGQQFYTPRGRERIIGVVKDFHAVSLVDPIRPFVLDMMGGPGGSFFMKYVVVRMRPVDLPKTLAHMQQEWSKLAPNHPFEYFFLNEQIDRLYDSQNRLAQLVAYFSVLAILIACSGLFALSAFSAEQRTKEIGLRKVMGASIWQISGMLAWDFLKLVLLSSFLAWLVVGWLMYDWLHSFAFHMRMPWELFALATLFITLLALLTVTYQALRAGSMNPVHALKED
jgi:putative ABC transport system permease protein